MMAIEDVRRSWVLTGVLAMACACGNAPNAAAPGEGAPGVPGPGENGAADDASAEGEVDDAGAGEGIADGGSADADAKSGDWYGAARLGLFLHWGMNTAQHGGQAKPIFTHVADFEKAANDGGWTASKWVSAATRLHAGYIALASFHSRLNYVKPWPSKIPGSPHTERDFLGELLAEAKKNNVRVIVYITPDPSHHADDGFEQLDKAAYAAYKNDPKLDITTPEGFGHYSYDVVMELLDRYPDIAGFWFDHFNGAWGPLHLLDTIRKRSPGAVRIINDSGDFDRRRAGEDVMSFEDIRKTYSPSYDYASALYAGPDVGGESTFKVSGGWWYGGSAPLPDYQKVFGRIVTSHCAGFNTLIGEGPQLGGDLSGGLSQFNGDFGDFMSWAEESLKGTSAGGYDKGGFQPGAWDKGAYGCTTIHAAQTGAQTHYLHVLTPPPGNVLTLDDGGYEVTAATALRSGQALSFTQDKGKLSITVPAWEKYDTVIKLAAKPPVHVIPLANIKATAAVQDSAHPAAGAVDGDYATYYFDGANATLPQEITLDLGAKYDLDSLKILQREDNPVTVSAGRYSTRIRGYDVSVGNDPKTFGAAVLTGELVNQRGVQRVYVSAKAVRYVKLRVTSNYNGGHGGDGVVKISGIEILGTPSP
jgi:alpha-L-fucosidase